MKKKRILLGLGAFAVLGLTTVLASCDGEKTYTVKFYNGSTEVASQTVTGGYNAKVPETTPTKEGSKFNGWYKDEALTTAFDFGSIIEGDTAVYAGWVNEFAVVFKDGTKTLSTQTVVNGFNAKVPTAPTSEGKVFNGWYEDAACQKAFNFGSTITKATTVYAGWVDQYTVTFKDGSRTVNTQTLTAGSMIEVPTLEEKSGKTFAGWFADALFTTAYDFANPVSSNTTIYAKWDSVYYTVSLMADANTKWKDISVEADDVLPTDLAPTKNYSVWDGKWYTDAACTQQFVSSTAIDGPITLYAGWNVETETVPYSFDYAPLLAAYPGKAKPTSIVKSGIFYLEPGMYFENSYANQSDSSKTNDPDFNTQKKAFWWSLKTGGKLSFDWKDRGSTTKFTIYRIPTVTDNSVVPTYTDDDIVYNKTTASLTSHFEYDCEEPGTYIFVSDGSIMVQQLTCTDVVEKSAPVSISVAGARDKFLVGTKFDTSGLTCTLNYANGSTESISAATDATDDKTGFVVENVELKEEGTYTVTVTYTAHDKYGDYPFTATYDVNAYDVDSVEAFTYGIDGSRNTFYNQLVYAVGDTFTSKDISVHAYGEIGESKYDELLSAGYSVSEPDMTTTGMKEVTVTYDGNTTATPSKFNIQVVEKLFDEKSKEVVLYVNPTEKAARKVESNQFTYKELEDNTKATYVFGTITEALQYLELCKVSDDAQKILILSDGTYNEKVFVDMPNVTIAGATDTFVKNGSNSGAVITFGAMNGIAAPNGNSYSTDGAATFTISKKATNCQVYNVTLQNDYNTHEEYVASTKITSGTQATAVLVRGDMAKFYNVSFSGYHDTLYADQGRQYYYNCYIEGRTDYIFGSTATAVFEDCVIKTLGAGLTEKNGGYVVATKGQSGQTYGYVFNHCQFTADENTQDGCVSIARGWDNYMTVMVMDCELGAHFSKGTYNQLYYTKTFADQEAFTAALEIGVYTYDATNEKYVKLAKDATLDAENQTYYMQFNDRYTKMNAIPHAELLFEYNNTGAGAITYSEELATKYAKETFTLMNPESEKDQATAAKYADLNTVFTAANGTVTYAENWNPTGTVAAIEFAGVTSENTENFAITLNHTYVGNTLVESQISSIKSTIKKSLKDGYTLIGLYTDSTYKTEFTKETKLTSNTTIYVRIIEGTLEEKTMSYSQANATNEGWTITGLSESKYNIISATPGKEVSKSDGKGAVTGNDVTYEDGVNTYWADKNATFKSPTITEAGVKEIAVRIYGGTSDTNDPVEFAITAYNASNTEVGSVKASGMGDSSTNGKRSGYVSLTKNGSQTSEYITVTATEDISYFVVSFTGNKFGGSAITKNYGVTSIDAKYEVIKKAEVQYEDKLDAYYFEGTTTNADATAVYTLKEEINGTTGTLGDLAIDGTTGKLNPRGSDSQMNAGCKITFTAKGDGQFVITSYPGYHNYTIKAGDADAVAATEDATTVQIVKGTTYVIEATSTSYLYSLLVSYKVEKQSTPETPETPVSQTTVLTFEGLDTSKMEFDSSSKLSNDYVVAATATTPSYTLSKGIKIEPNQKFYTYPDPADTNTKNEDTAYKGAINTQGNKKGVKIDLKAGDEVKVYFAASGSNNDRYVVLYSVGTDNALTESVKGTVVANAGTNAVVVDTLTVTTAGTYVIGTNNGLRITKIEITSK